VQRSFILRLQAEFEKAADRFWPAGQVVLLPTPVIQPLEEIIINPDADLGVLSHLGYCYQFGIMVA
jgi:hypothetical protein